MIYRSVAVCFYYITFFTCVNSDLLKTIMKKRDIGLQMCIQNFDVHKDKIIRTQDSKEMGAKYINEIDLGSREECLRLCCEIETCDVFVFEEKNSGSCYLFQCGPPEDFKCKFTHHANYSSAILTVNRHLPDLEKQIKLSKHEQDLTKLKTPESAKEIQKTPDKATTVLSTTAASYMRTIPISTAPPPSTAGYTKGTKCSRYQFECRSTKECIAIYNACDGIPQCADGSDEAYELGCPETTTKSVTPAHQKQASPIDNDISTIPKNGIAGAKQFSHSQTPNYYPLSSKHQQELTDIQVSEPDFVRPHSRIPHPITYDNQSPHYPQISKSQAENWMPHPPGDIGQQYQQYDDNNRLYNYKDSRLQVSEGQDIRYNYNKHKDVMHTLHGPHGYYSTGRSRFEDVRDNRKPNYYNSGYQQPQQYDDKWVSNTQENRLRNGNQYVQDPRQQWLPQTLNQDENSGLSQEPLESWKQEIPSIHHEHEKMAHELKHSKELMENIKNKVAPNSEKIENLKDHKPIDHIQYAKVTQYKVDLDLEDGIAETPGGAVLSLTLGLIITCVMALLIGCRLRIVKRRIRRGGKSYAHDTDYLVNGMYL